MKKYALTLDPLHVGAGGYRLGRVDNTIVRDAGSGLPKVPGSSLAGVARCYAGWVLQDEKKHVCAKCRGIKSEDAPTDRESCAVCAIFGYAADSEGKDKKDNDKPSSHIGLLRFYDGHILAFPVRTLAGPVWVTCPSVLAAHGFGLEQQPSNEELLVNFDVPVSANAQARLNLGWLYLPCKKLTKTVDLGLDEAAKALLTRLAIAPDWLFAEIVNSNLEVRTSVSIDPKTGAAESRLLFTYEAIPAATLLVFDVEVDTYRCRGEYTPESVRKLLNKALELCTTLGMGGMTTRGFGRVRFLTTQGEGQ